MSANIASRFCGRPLAVSIAVVFGAVAPAYAQEGEQRDRATGEFGAWLSHVESDNIARTLDGSRGSYDALGVLIGMANESTRVRSSVDVDLEFRTYSDDDLDDERVGNADALVDFAIVPERFNWYLRDTYSQGLTDPFAAVGPANRENVNILATGPYLTLPIGERTTFDIAADRMDRSYGESDQLDSTSTSAEVGLFRQSRRTTRYGLFVRSSEVDYDLSQTEYEMDGVGIRYERTLASGAVAMEVGQNELIFEDVEEDGPSLNFSWDRDVGSRSTLRISAAREFTDSGGLLGLAVTEPDVNEPTNVVPAIDPLEQERLDVGYSLDLSRTDVTITVGKYEDSFVVSTSLDNESTIASLTVARDFTPRLNISLRFDELRREFPQIAREDRDESVMLSLNRELSRRFDFGATVTQYERSGTESFDERRYELRLGYSPTR